MKKQTKKGAANVKARDSTRKQKKKGSKVLAKGAAGMGKTTLAKKVVWDWAQNDFVKYTCVFLVCLNEVDAAETVEKAFLQRTGLEVRETKLRKMLEKFGHRCLLILDGLDEIVTDGLVSDGWMLLKANVWKAAASC